MATEVQPKNAMLCICFNAFLEHGKKSAKLLAFENTWEGRVFGERQFLEKKGSKNMEYFFEHFFFCCQTRWCFPSS